jgi:GcrA cell cycle regulator
MSDWLPDHDAALRKHLRAAMTPRAAAAALNREFRTSYTRNSVISRARRIHVPLVSRAVQHHGGHSVSTDSAPKPKKAVTPAQRPDIAIRKAARGPKAPAVPFLPRPDPRPGQVPLLELAADGCRWPSGEGPYLFCNEPQLDGAPYCGPHCSLAYRAPEPRRTRQ